MTETPAGADPLAALISRTNAKSPTSLPMTDESAAAIAEAVRCNVHMLGAGPTHVSETGEPARWNTTAWSVERVSDDVVGVTFSAAKVQYCRSEAAQNLALAILAAAGPSEAARLIAVAEQQREEIEHKLRAAREAATSRSAGGIQ